MESVRLKTKKIVYKDCTLVHANASQEEVATHVC